MQKIDDKKLDELIEKIDELSSKVEPLIEIYVNSLGAYKVITGFLKLMVVISAGIGALMFIKKL